MKKFILLSCALIVGLSGSFAATPVAPKTLPLQPIATSTNLTLEEITQKIDRRIIFFNKYTVAKDTEGLKTLISPENGDFYKNLMKYIETAPVFTLKRDDSQANHGIIKTSREGSAPNEYSVTATLSMAGKTALVTMRFADKNSTGANTWVITDSNLHIIGQTLSSKTPAKIPEKAPVTSTGNLSSNAVAPKTPAKPATTPVVTTIPKPAVAAPLASAAIAKPNENPAGKASLISADSKGFLGGNIWYTIGIALGITLVLVLLGWFLFRFLKKRKSVQKALLAAQLVAISQPLAETIAVSDSPSIVPEQIPTTVEQDPPVAGASSAIEAPLSNVSLVENAPEVTIEEVSASLPEVSPTEAPSVQNELSTLSSTDMLTKETPVEVPETVETAPTSPETTDSDISVPSSTPEEIPTNVSSSTEPLLSPGIGSLLSAPSEQPIHDIFLVPETPSEIPSAGLSLDDIITSVPRSEDTLTPNPIFGDILSDQQPSSIFN